MLLVVLLFLRYILFQNTNFTCNQAHFKLFRIRISIRFRKYFAYSCTNFINKNSQIATDIYKALEAP